MPSFACAGGYYYLGGNSFTPIPSMYLLTVWPHTTVRQTMEVFVDGDGVVIETLSCMTLEYWNGVWVGRSRACLSKATGYIRSRRVPCSDRGVVGIGRGPAPYWNSERRVRRYVSQKPKDGGAFDIILQPSHGRAIQLGTASTATAWAIIGSGDYYGSGRPTSDSIVRFNVCSNTGLESLSQSHFAPRKEPFYLQTSFGGSLDGVGLQQYGIRESQLHRLRSFKEGHRGLQRPAANFFDNGLVLLDTTVDCFRRISQPDAVRLQSLRCPTSPF